MLRAKVSTFLKLVSRSQELERSLGATLALNTALADSEVRAQAVLQNVGDGIVTASETGIIELSNQSGLRMFGYREDEVVGGIRCA